MSNHSDEFVGLTITGHRGEEEAMRIIGELFSVGSYCTLDTRQFVCPALERATEASNAAIEGHERLKAAQARARARGMRILDNGQ